ANMYSDEELGYEIDDDLNHDEVSFDDVGNQNENFENDDYNLEDGFEFNDYSNESENNGRNKKMVIIAILLIAIVGLFVVIKDYNKTEAIPSIKILSDKEEIKINEVVDLNVDMKNNSHNNLLWEITDSKVASINDNGEVTGLKLGKAKVLVTYVHSNNKKYVDDCDIVVYQGTIGVSLNSFKTDETIRLKLGNSGQIVINFEPSNAYIYQINYQSVDNSIASVKENGVITANRIGETQVVITVNETITKQVSVIVYDEDDKQEGGKPQTPSKPSSPVINPSSVRFNDSEIEIKVSETKTLNYQVLPVGAKNYSVSFENSDNTVLRVNQDGTIKGISIGTANVTVIINNQYRATIKVKVIPYIIDVGGILLKSSGNLSLGIGDTSMISYEVDSKYATYRAVTFTSSNKNVVTVDSNGLIKAVGRGEATITIKTVDGSKSSIINVLVN
ncbi:MAG: Ig-like domain-containing protein, partial [Bacilli bacterium]|nr:Ig-like domain-containing protein [Bacilli bacterium]